MRTPARRYIILAVFSISAALAATHLQSERKAAQSHEMTVNSARETLGVSIDVTIINDLGVKLVMPSCGQIIDKYVVCLPPAFVEQYDGKEWQKVKEKGDHMYGELAAPRLANIEPGKSMGVNAGFPLNSYEWQLDQPVRLVIPLWPASDSKRVPATRILYVTPPLQPPNAGELAFEPK